MTYAERFSDCVNKIPGKTRQGVAAAMGVSQQAVGQIMKGKTKAATAENNAKAAQYFGVDATWLATGRGSKFSAGHETALRAGRQPDDPPGLLLTLQHLAGELAPCPVAVRETLGHLLHRLALNPADESIPVQIALLVASSSAQTKLAANA